MTETYREIINNTNRILYEWKNSSYGIAPTSVSEKFDNTNIELCKSLTNVLGIWIEKDIFLTDGELILANVNMGGIVEYWLQFFYTVYYEEYIDAPIYRKNNNIEPEDTMLKQLQDYSVGILWEETDSIYKWVDYIRVCRNAIHPFKKRDYGTPKDFLDGVNRLDELIRLIDSRLPDLAY